MEELKEFFPFWDKLPPHWQEKLSAGVSRHTYPKGTLIHRGRQDCIGLLLILKGQARSYIITDEGREADPLSPV